MSHTVKTDLQILDIDLAKEVAKKLGLRVETGTFKLFSTTETGTAVYLPGWKYPIVIHKDGTVSYDNYNGRWGNEKELSKFKVEYTIEKTKKEARKKGYSTKLKRGQKTRIEIYVR